MSLDPINKELIPFLELYMPPSVPKASSKPFVTLTYAQSLDSRISLGPGIRTAISDMETKVMTHYLRFHHAGILIGSGTVLADDPGLNCKWLPSHAGTVPLNDNSPTPIIIDPSQKWQFTGSKMHQLFTLGEGKSPIVIVSKEPETREADVRYVVAAVDATTDKFDWDLLLTQLKSEFGLDSVMVEGGAYIINELLNRPDIVDSLVVTVGSTYLGAGGVAVSPAKPMQLDNVNWWKGKRDSVMGATLK